MANITKYHLYLDKETTENLKTGKYLIYRSKETEDNSPIIDGFYIQSIAFLFEEIPEEISITVEY